MEHAGMVDALAEIRRVLVPGGILLDVRPLAAAWPVEVACAASSREVGRLIDLPEALADDEASEAAMAEVEARGWFRLESREHFWYDYYWDRPSEMKEFIETEWDDFERLDEAVLQAAQSAWASADAEARLRIRIRIHLAGWTKA